MRMFHTFINHDYYRVVLDDFWEPRKIVRHISGGLLREEVPLRELDPNTQKQLYEQIQLERGRLGPNAVAAKKRIRLQRSSE